MPVLTSTTQKNAPDAGQGVEGEDQPQRKEPIDMIIAQGTPIHPDIQEVIDAHPRHMGFTAGDFHAETPDELIQPLSVISGEIVVGESMHSLGRFYTFAGERVSGGIIPDVPHFVRTRPNAAHLMDDGIFVSDGMWLAVELTTLDGEPAIRLESEYAGIRRWMAERAAHEAAYAAAHPQIAASMPGWADRLNVFVHDQDVEPSEINYDRTIGSGTASVLATLDGGRVVFGGPPEFRFSYEPDATPADAAQSIAWARAAIADMQAVVEAVEATL